MAFGCKYQERQHTYADIIIMLLVGRITSSEDGKCTWTLFSLSDRRTNIVVKTQQQVENAVAT